MPTIETNQDDSSSVPQSCVFETDEMAFRAFKRVALSELRAMGFLEHNDGAVGVICITS